MSSLRSWETMGFGDVERKYFLYCLTRLKEDRLVRPVEPNRFRKSPLREERAGSPCTWARETLGRSRAEPKEWWWVRRERWHPKSQQRDDPGELKLLPWWGGDRWWVRSIHRQNKWQYNRSDRRLFIINIYFLIIKTHFQWCNTYFSTWWPVLGWLWRPQQPQFRWCRLPRAAKRCNQRN